MLKKKTVVSLVFGFTAGIRIGFIEIMRKEFSVDMLAEED